MQCYFHLRWHFFIIFCTSRTRVGGKFTNFIVVFTTSENNLIFILCSIQPSKFTFQIFIDSILISHLLKNLKMKQHTTAHEGTMSEVKQACRYGHKPEVRAVLGKLGPGQLGPICHFFGAYGWAPGPNCPGPNFLLFQGG